MVEKRDFPNIWGSTLKKNNSKCSIGSLRKHKNNAKMVPPNSKGICKYCKSSLTILLAIINTILGQP